VASYWNLGALETWQENSLEQRELKHDRKAAAKPNPRVQSIQATPSFVKRRQEL
jgi:hypothetical protein